MKKISLILACTFDGGIGLNNDIPWKIRSDFIKFKEITTKTIDETKKNALIMGSNTFKSIGKPLPNRINIVLSRYKTYDNAITMGSIEDSIEYCNNCEDIETIYIIGGSYIYNYFIESDIYDYDIIMSLIKEYYECDTYIDIKSIFRKFNFIKSKYYNNDSEFISYICKKKSQQNITQ